MEHMTRRRFVELAAIATGGLTLAGLVGCAATESAEPAALSSAAGAPVYLVRNVDDASLRMVFDALGQDLRGGKVGVKLSSGEPGGNHYLQPALIEGLVSSVSGTIIECNTAYGGGRSTTEAHYRVAADHGFTSIADFQIMDEAGSLTLPVEGGFHLSEDLVGAAFSDYDAFLVLSHFKGHAMAGFGGALKNISIGMASREGKLLIHSAGANRT
ncbi:MAG: DUF362 domain-containing protein, partial [Atopobiaceae bacterium]|nr:DUF362 domain-containing protein [Atopobiaceae bacterium]